MTSIDKMAVDGTFDIISKKERLQITRERAKLEKQFGSIADLSRLPAAVFIVDIMKEHIAVAESHKLNIPTFAIVDTNSDPNLVDFPIPANDDASKSIAIILKIMMEAIQEGLAERKLEKDKAADDDDRDVDVEDEDGKKVKSLREVEESDDEESEAAKNKARKLKLKEEEEADGMKKAAKAPKGATAARRPRK